MIFKMSNSFSLFTSNTYYNFGVFSYLKLMWLFIENGSSENSVYVVRRDISRRLYSTIECQIGKLVSYPVT